MKTALNNQEQPLPLTGRTALITGASRGIGAGVAKRFAAEGAHVILVARSEDGLKATDDAIRSETGRDDAATLIAMDLKQGEEVDALGAALYNRFGKLDILVGSAGMLGDLTPVAHCSPKVWDNVLATNLTANFRLLRSLDPLLRESAKETGRADVLLVSSGVTKGSFPYWGPYAVSKAGLEALAQTYGAEVEKAGIHVSVIDPGIVRTHMRALAFPGEDAEKLPAPDARQVTDKFMSCLL